MLDPDTATSPADETPLATANEGSRTINSVDATSGQPIVDRVMSRKHELEALLAKLPEHELRARGDIELALNTINSLLTGDLTHVPAMVVADMSRWLELNKHLAESAVGQIDPVTSPIAADDPDMPPRD